MRLRDLLTAGGRGDDGYWQQLEQYVDTHTDADVTHGICTECSHEVLPSSGPT